MERLVLELLIWLLKLVVQLIMLAATGKWYRFGPGARMTTTAPAKAEPKPARSSRKRQRKQQQAKPASVTEPRPARRVGERTFTGAGPAVFEFAPELVELEPDSEDAALAREGELQARRARARGRAKLKVQAVPAQPRSIAAAMRDRNTVRKALVLGAAFGPGRPRF
ncbi:MAG: hypothetical protein JWN04_3968 [Myxococcaceae bacterium]|nr:hypothetical protein [Myxococcaceae bacterium]